MGGTGAQLPVGWQASLLGYRPGVASAYRRPEDPAEGEDDRIRLCPIPSTLVFRT
jgi:hypothetical protein